MSASIGDLQQRIDSLTQAVTNESTVESSAMTLISGIPQMIQDAINQALANGATPEQLAALDNLVSSINSSASNLAGAVAANTPAPSP